MLFATTAGAYSCNVDPRAPVNAQGSDGNTKVKSAASAACPNNTEFKRLGVTVVRIRTALPDIQVASDSDSGQQRNYFTNAMGCDSGGSGDVHGYKTVANFTNQGDSQSAPRDLFCKR